MSYDWQEFRHWAHQISDWASDYRQNIKSYRVRAVLKPGSVLKKIPEYPPKSGESMDTIFADFKNIILPNITHWQHPSFFAYFPANASPASVLGEYVTAAMAVNSLLWQTSPAASELETRMMEWLAYGVGICTSETPKRFQGVIHDSASSATFAAVVMMRERVFNQLGKDANKDGLFHGPVLRIYGCEHAHSSIEKAIGMAGIGRSNYCPITTTGEHYGLNPTLLKDAIERDLAKGFKPAGIIASIGSTGIGGCDNLEDLSKIALQYNLFLHVDAAWAGSAMLCDEFRVLWQGIEHADSLVFNPHKWMGVHFDCSAFFVKDPKELVATLGFEPEYLKTNITQDADNSPAIDYSKWSIQLGRRFRALKLWFHIRTYGLDSMQSMIRNHVAWASWLGKQIQDHDHFRLTSRPILSMLSFQASPPGVQDIESFNHQLLENLNDQGSIYLTKTIFQGETVIRFQVGSLETRFEDVQQAWKIICKETAILTQKH